MEIDGSKPKNQPWEPKFTETKASSNPGESKPASDAKSKSIDLEYTPNPMFSANNAADFLKKAQTPLPKSPSEQYEGCVKAYATDGEMIGHAIGDAAGHAVFHALGMGFVITAGGSHAASTLVGAAGEKVGADYGKAHCGKVPEEPKILPNVPKIEAKKPEAKTTNDDHESEKKASDEFAASTDLAKNVAKVLDHVF